MQLAKMQDNTMLQVYMTHMTKLHTYNAICHCYNSQHSHKHHHTNILLQNFVYTLEACLALFSVRFS